MNVMMAIQATPTSVVATTFVERSAIPGMPSSPRKVNEYDPAICARFAMTMTSAAMIPQPPIQPVFGPNARAAQVKVVPQSGSALLSSWYATAMRYMGMNASSTIPG